jgi:hypothetical protein
MALSLDGTTGISASGNITGNNVIASGALIVSSFSPASLSTAGNITGSYILGNGSQLTGIDATSIQNGTSNVRVVSSGGNVTFGVSGTSNVAVFTSGGATFGTGYLTAGNISNGNGNGVGNIGNAVSYFNTVFAKATSAQYADLAEMYLSDQPLHAGTVVEFGGDQEITICTVNHSPRVAGIISTRPSHLMNATLSGEHVYPVALTGRVPCTVIGLITKGDCLVSSDHPGAARKLDPEKFVPGCIVGKALQDHDSDSVGTIEVAVGRF